MQYNIFHRAVITAAMLISANLTFAADTKVAATGEPKAVSTTTSTKVKAATQADTVKLVDINSAKKEELKTLPGISDAEATKIIAGRPYGSKSHLTTHNIVSREVYEGLKGLVIAKQRKAPAAKPAKK
jgi:DNA uptake protein ComE-like DNA-binding protein